MRRRTLLPRTPLQNSDAVASNAPVDPGKDKEILGPESEPTTQPASQPATQPSSQPGPIPPVDPRPRVLLVHPESTVIATGEHDSAGSPIFVRNNAEGPIFARDPLAGAATLMVGLPRDFSNQISLYQSIGRLVIFVRRVPGLVPGSRAGTWHRYRKDFDGFFLPPVTEGVEFEAPHVADDKDIQYLVNFAKMFSAPRCTVWNYPHGAEVLALATRGRKEKEIEKAIKGHKDFLLDRTPSAALIVRIAGSLPFYEIATEWFDPDDTLPTPPRPKKGVLRRGAAVRVTCKEPDYSQVDFNVGAKLQQIEIETDLSIPLPPLK